MISEITELVKFLRNTYNKRYALGGISPYLHLKKIRESFRSRLMIEFLEKRYKQYQLLTCAGHKYPIVVFPCPSPMIRIKNFSTPTPVIKNLDEKFGMQLKFFTKHKQFYWFMRSSIPVYNSRTFIMKNISLNGLPKIDCGVSSYFDVLVSSYSLEWEILRAFSIIEQKGISELRKVLKYLPLREKLHRHIVDPVKDGRGRASGIAISTLVAYTDLDKQTLFLLRRRGALSITMRKGLFHVLPSGMFESQFGDYQIEFNLLHAILWEYIEEYFSYDDPSTQRVSSRWFYDLQPAKEMLGYLESGAAELYITGIGVDLLNLRPEIFMLLFIKDNDWAQRHEMGIGGSERFKFNAEWANPSGIQMDQKPLIRIPFQGDSDRVFRDGELFPGQITPPGAAALWLGARALQVERD